MGREEPQGEWPESLPAQLRRLVAAGVGQIPPFLALWVWSLPIVGCHIAFYVAFSHNTVALEEWDFALPCLAAGSIVEGATEVLAFGAALWAAVAPYGWRTRYWSALPVVLVVAWCGAEVGFGWFLPLGVVMWLALVLVARRAAAWFRLEIRIGECESQRTSRSFGLRDLFVITAAAAVAIGLGKAYDVLYSQNADQYAHLTLLEWYYWPLSIAGGLLASLAWFVVLFLPLFRAAMRCRRDAYSISMVIVLATLVVGAYQATVLGLVNFYYGGFQLGILGWLPVLNGVGLAIATIAFAVVLRSFGFYLDRSTSSLS